MIVIISLIGLEVVYRLVLKAVHKTEVEEKTECLKYTSPIIKQADYFLETPNIHLRYFLEGWLTDLTGWVKFNYIDNLRYWSFEEFWIDARKRKIGAEYFRSLGKFEYYDKLREQLETALFQIADCESKDPGFQAVVGKMPQKSDDY